MPKVFLTKDRKVDVTKEDAERIESELLSNEKMIRVTETMLVKRGEVKGVERGRTGSKNGYDLNDNDDRQIVRGLETTLEALRSGELTRDLAWYGHPFGNQEKFPGFVTNELCGGVHWTVVQYALDQRLIARNEKGCTSWAIKEPVGAYSDFRAKLDGLVELRGRRAYAQAMAGESVLGEISRFKDGVGRMPNPELELPF